MEGKILRGKYLEDALIAWSAEHSGFDERRDYVGLSGICDCPRVILSRYRKGQTATTESRLKTRLTYEMEHSLISRLSGFLDVLPSREIVAKVVDTEAGQIKIAGHTDGSIQQGNGDMDLLEIGTIPLAEYFPVPGKLPMRKYWQCQAYMYYGVYAKTQLIFQARDTGDVRVYEVFPNQGLINKIQDKVDAIAEALESGKEAKCLCGRCDALKKGW